MNDRHIPLKLEGDRVVGVGVARAEAAHTPLPWRVDSRFSLRIVAGDNCTVASVGCAAEIRDAWESNAALIVTSVNDRPALLARVAELEAALRFYADPFAWKELHDPDNDVQVPDFYRETSFGDTASAALSTTDRRPEKCDECEQNYADPPSKLCPGCQAYREHQA